MATVGAQEAQILIDHHAARLLATRERVLDQPTDTGDASFRGSPPVVATTTGECKSPPDTADTSPESSDDSW